MHLTDLSEELRKALPTIQISARAMTIGNSSQYFLDSLPVLLKGLKTVRALDLSLLNHYIDELTPILIGKNPKSDTTSLSLTDYNRATELVKSLHTSIMSLIAYAEQVGRKSEDTLKVKLPHFDTFDQFGKICTELKHAIEFPIYDSNTEGKVEIKTAEPGSIILFINVGTLGALSLIGAICLAAIKIRSEYVKTSMTLQHVKTLQLKNEMIEELTSATKQQLKNMTAAEAKEIADGYYDASDPEKLKRLELSIKTVSDLIDKGALLAPADPNSSVQKAFPSSEDLLSLIGKAKGIEGGE